MMKHTNSLLHGSAGLLESLATAWPIVISMLSYTAMGVADTLFVGWLGTEPLAGVGLATTAVFLVNALFIGTLGGIKILSAQQCGAGRSREAIQTGTVGILLALPCGLLAMLAVPFGAPLITAFGGPPIVQAHGTEYFVVRMLGAPLMFVLVAATQSLQGRGAVISAMRINVFSNALNIVLDPILIFGAGMGTAGAAWASVAAYGAGALAALVIVGRQRGGVEIWERKLALSILRLGLPMGVRFVLDVAGFSLLTALLVGLGPEQLAAHVIALKIVSVSFLPGHGISEAASVLVGRAVGAGDRAATRRAFISAVVLSTALMGAFALVFLLAPSLLLSAFRPEPEVTAIAIELLAVAAAFQIADAIAMSAIGALNGRGDVRFVMGVGIIACWLVMLPLAYFFAVELEGGAAGAWWALTAEISLLAGVFVHRLRKLQRDSSNRRPRTQPGTRRRYRTTRRIRREKSERKIA